MGSSYFIGVPIKLFLLRFSQVLECCGEKLTLHTKKRQELGNTVKLPGHDKCKISLNEKQIHVCK